MQHADPETATIELRGVRKSFGPVEVIHGLDLEIEGGRVLSSSSARRAAASRRCCA